MLACGACGGPVLAEEVLVAGSAARLRLYVCMHCARETIVGQRRLPPIHATRQPQGRRPRFTAADCQAIRNQASDGAGLVELARRWSCSDITIRRVLGGDYEPRREGGDDGPVR